MLPKRLVFCGGGTKCLVFLQGLVDLEKRGTLKNVNEYWGTSAGAMIASLYALTSSPQKIKDVMFSANYLKFRDIDISNILGIQSSWGLDDGKSLTQEIENMFESIGPGTKNKVLSDIPSLNIVVSDISIRETIICNSKTHPSLRIVDALRASMSLPIFFKPYRHVESGHFWVDGAIKANFPWHCLPDDLARSEALGFTFEKPCIYRTPETFMEYIFSMIHFDEPKKTQILKKHWSSNIIWFPQPPYPTWFIRLQKTDFDLIEQLGKEGIEKWFRPLSKTQACPPLCEDHRTQKSLRQMNYISGMSDSPLPGLLRCSHDNSSTLPRPFPLTHQVHTPSKQTFCRRWSV